MDMQHGDTRLIETEQDIRDGLGALAGRDPLIARVWEAAGEVPLRRSPGGFEGLVRITTAQQLSVSAAGSIWAKLQKRIRPMTPDRLLRTRDATLRSCGLSAPKIRTVRAVAAALDCGMLDLERLGVLPVAEATEHLCQVKGIGPWTAEIYLLFCLGHPDIFPAGDLALQVAVQHALALDEPPDPRALVLIAERWRPWRGVAARLFWSYYRVCKAPSSGLPV